MAASPSSCKTWDLRAMLTSSSGVPRVFPLQPRVCSCSPSLVTWVSSSRLQTWSAPSQRPKGVLSFSVVCSSHLQGRRSQHCGDLLSHVPALQADAGMGPVCSASSWGSLASQRDCRRCSSHPPHSACPVNAQALQHAPKSLFLPGPFSFIAWQNCLQLSSTALSSHLLPSLPTAGGPRQQGSHVYCFLNGSSFAWHTNRYLTNVLYGHKEWVIHPPLKATALYSVLILSRRASYILTSCPCRQCYRPIFETR